MPRASINHLVTIATTDDDPGENRQAFGERHADQHRREDFAERTGVAADGHDAASSGDAHADGRATKRQTDVNVTDCFCEHHIFYWLLVLVSRNRSPKGLPVANFKIINGRV